MIAVLAVGTFLMGTSEFVVAGLLDELASEFGTSVAHAGLAITVFAIGMIIGAPAATVLTLRLPRRMTLGLALVLFSVGHLVAALTSSWGVLLAARAGTALATGAFWAVAAVVAAEVVGPAASSRALGVVIGGGMLANVVGVPLGAFVAQAWGWRGPFLSLCVAAVIVSIAVWAIVPADGPHREAPSVRAEVAGLRSRRLWMSLAACAFVNAGVLSVYGFISPLLVGRAHLAPSVLPVALLLFGAGSFVGSLVGGRLGGRWPFATPVSVMAVTVGAMLLLCAFSTSAAPALLLVTVLGLIGLSAHPVLVTRAVAYGGAAPTLASAMATSLFNVGTATGTWLTGLALATSIGTLAPAVAGLAFTALACATLGALAFVERPSSRLAAVGG